jgi:hypothetical protein
MPNLLPIALLICLLEVSSAAILILNPSFESSDMSAWNRTAITGIRPWGRGSASAQDGSWYVFTVDEASISQSFSSILGAEVTAFTFWVDRPTTANMFIELSYQDGSSSGRVSINGGTAPGWGLYDALSLVEPTKQLTGLSIIKTGTGTARLDNFQLVAVPETSTVALCIPGLGLLLRRKRLIGSRGVVSSPVPHHPAYGSVQGGSNQTRASGP